MSIKHIPMVSIPCPTNSVYTRGKVEARLGTFQWGTLLKIHLAKVILIMLCALLAKAVTQLLPTGRCGRGSPGRWRHPSPSRDPTPPMPTTSKVKRKKTTTRAFNHHRLRSQLAAAQYNMTISAFSHSI